MLEAIDHPLKFKWVEYLQPGHTVLDVGANLGVYTKRMAHAVGPTGRVYAIEPLPDCCAYLTHKVPSATILSMALGAVNGTADFYECALPVHSTLWPANAKEIDAVIQVPVRTLDSLMADGTLPDHFDFIKLDAQGAEMAILRGAQACLAQRHATWMIEIWPEGLTHAGSSANELCALLQAAGYAAVGIYTDEAPAPHRDAPKGTAGTVGDYETWRCQSLADSWDFVKWHLVDKTGHAAIDVIVAPYGK